MKIVFFGTSDFAARVLEHIAKEHTLFAIVTRPDRPQGRSLKLTPPAVKALAMTAFPSTPLHQPEKASSSDFAELLRTYQADLFLVVAFGEIIKKNLLEMPPLGCINIHASLLPKYRGAAPMQRALMNGEKKTGITLIEMTPEMDAGDILATASLDISPEMTLGELDSALCCLACTLLDTTLPMLQAHALVKTPQDHSAATLAPKINPIEQQIQWHLPAEKIHNLVRALSPHPGAWCNISIGGQIKRLKILRTRPLAAGVHAPATLLSCTQQSLAVACGFGALELLELQLEGKKPLSAPAFVNGLHQSLSFFS